jgi:hypothetical protein
MGRVIFFMLIPIIATGCAISNAKVNNEANEKNKFALTNCLMWYMQSKGYDTEDIRSISGGIVETSDISLDEFQKIALLVKEYEPTIQTKQNIDINLLKCFYLEESEELNKILGK